MMRLLFRHSREHTGVAGGNLVERLFWITALAVMTILIIISSATASDNIFNDPAQEEHARKLFSQLRCVVCEGQPLSGSNTKIAIEMRNVIREKMKKGESDEDIIAFFAERYGDDVLMNPPVSPQTYVLWFAPPFFLLLALWVGLKVIRSNSN